MNEMKVEGNTVAYIGGSRGEPTLSILPPAVGVMSLHAPSLKTKEGKRLSIFRKGGELFLHGQKEPSFCIIVPHFIWDIVDKT